MFGYMFSLSNVANFFFLLPCSLLLLFLLLLIVFNFVWIQSVLVVIGSD